MNSTPNNVSSRSVCVIYNCFPHYRRGVLEALAASEKIDYTFMAAEFSFDPSIRIVEPAALFPNFKPCPLWIFGPIWFQGSLLFNRELNSMDAVIVLGNPYGVSYWLLALYMRARGKPLWFWTHGWIDSSEAGVKSFVRDTFYRLSSGLLLYGEHAKRIGVEHGFPVEKLRVINNSLDFPTMAGVFEGVKQLPRSDQKIALGFEAEIPLIVCSARLTAACRFELLIDAAEILSKQGLSLQLALIGDGPESARLAGRAKECGVRLKMVGATYEESVLACYYHASDLMVSPGKVGLAAIHSMSYGTPVVTHADGNHQMPEFQSIVPGVTGDFFKRDDVEDLAKVIATWVERKSSDPHLSQRCINRIRSSYSPESQVTAIEAALFSSLER